MNYLVTGGTGFIGSHLVIDLLKKGHKVKVLDNDFRGSIGSLREYRKDIEFIKADIRDKKKVKKACEGIDIVIHLASVNGTEIFYQIPDQVLDVSTRGIINVIDGCIENNVPELYVASSSEVYYLAPIIPAPETVPLVIPDPHNARYSYAGGKIISELYTIHFGKYFKKAIIFRPHNVYGPNMGKEHVIPQFIEKLKVYGAEFPIQGTGQETRAFIYIDDFVQALNLIVDKGKHGEIYHIGTDQEITITDLANKMAKIYFDREIKIIPGALQSGGTVRRVPNVDKIKKLGFKPQVSLEEGLRKTWEWYA